MTLFERLRPAAVGLFAAGLAARLATPEASPGDPIARMLLLSGAGWILLDAAARGRPTAPWWALALPWTLLAAAKPWDQDAVGAAAELFAAAIAGFAARTLAADGQGGAVRRALAALFGLAAAFAVAQTLYLRAEAEAVARAAGDPLFATAQAQAFLASRRGFATFGSPNAFAGALLLALPAVALAAFDRARRRVAPAAAALTALLFAGFVAAGSAGAVAALLGALPIAAALGAPPRSPRRRRAALLVAAWLAGCLTLAAAANASTAPTGKTATLRERLDYARTGLRMAADSGPFGVGLERVAESAPRYRRPGEAFSRSLHNWWLEGWVEAGIWFVLAAAPATWSILRRLRSVAATTSSTPPVAAPRDRAWPIGIALGVAVAGLAARSVRFTPYGAIADPTVDVVVNAALATAVVLAFRRLAADVGVDGPLPRRAAAIGLLAFLLHGWIDYDLKVAGVAVAFGAWWGASTAAAPAGAVARRADRIAAAALGAAALLAPLIVGPAE